MTFGWKMNLQSMPGSIPIGSILRIPIRLHLLFFVLLVAQLLGSIPRGPPVVLLWFVLLGPVLLLTILVHELGHALGARIVGGDCVQILLWPLGGLAFIGHNAGPKADMLVSVAGPLTHIPMVGIWLGLLAAATHANTGAVGVSLSPLPYPDTTSAFFQALCASAVLMNIALFVFNLFVPAYPLDGGRLLVDALLTFGVRPVLAAKITLGVAVPLALGIAAFGIAIFQIVTILVAIFVLFSCWQLFDAMRKDQLDQHPLFSYTSPNSEAAGGEGQQGAGSRSHEEAAQYYKFGRGPV